MIHSLRFIVLAVREHQRVYSPSCQRQVNLFSPRLTMTVLSPGTPLIPRNDLLDGHGHGAWLQLRTYVGGSSSARNANELMSPILVLLDRYMRW